MRTMERFLLVLVGLALALRAAPAAAARERREGFRGWHRKAREERHARREHDRWGHRRFGLFPLPSAALS